MTHQHIADHFRDIGIQVGKSDGEHEQAMIPLVQDGVVFRQMFEYPVADFEAEVGFFISVFGLQMIALDSGYALFQHPDAGYCFSFRKDASMPLPDSIGLKLLFMTTDISLADAHMEQTRLVPDRQIRPGSPVQQVIHFSSPNGVAIEIWQMPTDG